jgi:hypothetical protein
VMGGELFLTALKCIIFLTYSYSMLNSSGSGMFTPDPRSNNNKEEEKN